MDKAEVDAFHGSLESRLLDIKREPPRTNRLVEIIQSGANGIEPMFRIIMGIDEDSDGRLDKNLKVPITFPLTVDGNKTPFKNFDAYRLHLLSSVQSQTDGYFEGMFTITEVPIAGGCLIVIEVPQSPGRPHLNTQSHRFFIRADGSTRPMKPAEIRSTMGKVEAAPEPFPAPLPFGPGSIIADVSGDWAMPDIDAVRLAETETSMTLRVIPQATSRTWTATQLREVYSAWKETLPTLGRWSNGNHSRNEHGFILYGLSQNSPGVTNTLTQVFENGEVASLLAHDPDDERGRGCIPSTFVRERFTYSLFGILRFSVMALNVDPPFDLVCTIEGVKGNLLILPGHPFREATEPCVKDLIQSVICIDADVVEKIVGAKDGETSFSEAHSALIPFFSEVWDACGVIWKEDLSSKMVR